MESCVICGHPQDMKHFPNYNICTTCHDLLEDVMSEYFLRTIRKKGNESLRGYLRYLENSSSYISDYSKIKRESKLQLQRLGERLRSELQAEGSKKRYLESMQETLEWLKETPDFYNYYFKEYYVCPMCGASIFDHFDEQEIGDWLIISCERCGTVIKKYYSPKLI